MDDANSDAKILQVGAPEYINLSMESIKSIIDDETIFPSQSEVSFPKNFVKKVKEIMKKIFRIYAHLYLDIKKLGLEAHVNTSLKHFIAFNMEFELLNKKELRPLEDYIHNQFNGKFDSKMKK